MKRKVKLDARDVFKTAFENLKGKDQKIAKDIIMRRNGWSPQLFSMKMTGERELSEYSDKKINELQVVESTFRGYGIDAWSGKPIT